MNPAAPLSVLILYSGAGGGHLSLAKALRRALQTVRPGTEAHLCDPLLDPDSSKLLHRFTASYGETIRRSPRTWAMQYWTARAPGVRQAMRRVITTKSREFVDAQMARARPHLIVPVQPLLVHPGRQAVRRSSRPCGLLPVLCDLVTVHPDWACVGSDLLIVGTERARRAAIAHGARRVALLGQPVDAGFRPADAEEKAALRLGLGLSPDRPTLLLTGGAEGAGNLHEQLRVLGRMREDCQLVVVAGRDETVRKELAAITTVNRTVVLGFVDNMPDLLRAADIVVGKAGSQTVAEALASAIPLVLTRALPGQERGNIEYVTQLGCGIHAPDGRSLAEAARKLVRDPVLRSAMGERSRRTPHGAAALKVARECLRIAAEYQRAGASGTKRISSVT